MTRFLSAYRDYVFIALFVLLTSAIVWLPFVPQLSAVGIHIKNTDTGVLYRNYDGLLYVIASKTFYSPDAINALHLENGLSASYYAAHLPLYPAIIRGLSFLGYPKAMIAVTVLSTVLLGWMFYYLVRQRSLTKRPLLLTMTMLMLPRFLVVRSVGSPESLFMLLTLVSILFFEKKNYIIAGLAGGLAVMTKLPGILLFPGFALAELVRYRESKKFTFASVWLFLIPAGLLAVCMIYARQYQDPFAYWHTGYVVPMPYPFSAFDVSAKWVGTHWLEEIVLYLYLYAATVINSYRHQLRSLFYFSLVFFVGLIFVQHRDISRYALPLWPITCIIFEKFFTSKRAMIAMVVLLPAIYLYAWSFIQGNAMPVGNWAPYL